jgi:hypothetical protein
VTLRAADLRFSLPGPVDTVRVLGGSDLRPLAAGLRAAGMEVLPDSSSALADLVVGDASALAVPAGAHLIIGGTVRGTARRRVQPLLLRGDPSRPTLVVPLDQSGSLREHLRHRAAMHAPLARARNLALAVAAAQPSLPPRFLPSRSLATVVTSTQRTAPPLLLAAAHELGLPPDPGWVLALGSGDDLQRAVFHVSHGGQRRWVVKFSRVRGHDAPFQRDAEGLALARSSPVAAARAPRLLGRLTVSGTPLSVESAAPGHPLADWLLRYGRTPGAIRLLEDLSAWVVDVGVQTAEPAAALESERRRLSREVLPAWLPAGAPADLVLRLPPVPGVLAHQDLGTWNVITDGTSSMAVDWESARRPAMPLWDLLYLLGDGLVRLDGETDRAVLTSRALALFRGESPQSPMLFSWVGRAVRAQGLPADAVGPLATLCWLHHGLSAVERGRALAGAAPAPTGHLARLAAGWLLDPALGPTWAAWSKWSRSSGVR